MNSLYQITFLLLIITSCTCWLNSSAQTFSSEIPKVHFCDLPKHEGRLVLIEGVYSGVDEYWAINSLKKCKEKFNVQLDYYLDGSPIPEKFQPLFDSAYGSYYNTYLIIQASGTYESKKPPGEGPLSSNNSRFIVKEIVDVKLVRRK